jgi:hypothetical protein
MELSNTMLVAIMFATILTLGVANLLGTLAATVSVGAAAWADRLHLSWIVLFLLMHLNMFWHTSDVVSQEWGFGGFLYVIAGPILMFFSTQTLLAGSASEKVEPREAFLAVAPRFFRMFAVVQLWILGADAALGRGFTSAGAINVAILLGVLVLSASRESRHHVAGVWIAGLLFVGSLALRGLGIIPRSPFAIAASLFPGALES